MRVRSWRAIADSEDRFNFEQHGTVARGEFLKMVEAIRISNERHKRLEAAIEEPAGDDADCRLSSDHKV
jgi:hypothetical protein